MAATDVMEGISDQQAARDAARTQADRAELVERIARAMRADGTIQPFLGCT